MVDRCAGIARMTGVAVNKVVKLLGNLKIYFHHFWRILLCKFYTQTVKLLIINMLGENISKSGN